MNGATFFEGRKSLGFVNSAVNTLLASIRNSTVQSWIYTDTKIFSQNYTRQQSPFSLSDHFYWCTWIAERHLHYKVLKTLAPFRLIHVHVNVHSKGDDHPGECQTRKYTCKQISSLYKHLNFGSTAGEFDFPFLRMTYKHFCNLTFSVIYVWMILKL